MGECECNVLSLEKGFNKQEYEELISSKSDMLKFTAYPEYRWQLLKRRDNENLDFKETKENVVRLFLESFSDGEYKRLLKNLKANGWTLEQAYKRVLETGRTISYISRIRNV